MPDIDIAIARPDQREAIANLLQLYVHDFSELWTGSDRGELRGNGRFNDYPGLDRYWSEPDHIPLLIASEGRLVGFAFLNRHSHSGGEPDWNVGEFFIVRKYRRGGYGSAALAAILKRWPGQWEAAVVRANVGALAFWRRAIAANPSVTGVTEVDVSGEDWNGPVLRFNAG